MARSLRRHAAALALGLVAVSMPVTLAAAAPEASRPASVPGPVSDRAPVAGSIVATPAHGAPGTRVALTGLAEPRRVHQVRLQRLQGSRWVPVARSKTRRTGAFRFTVVLPAGLPSVSYRVVTPRAAGVRPSRTPAWTCPTWTPARRC